MGPWIRTKLNSNKTETLVFGYIFVYIMILQFVSPACLYRLHRGWWAHCCIVWDLVIFLILVFGYIFVYIMILQFVSPACLYRLHRGWWAHSCIVWDLVIFLMSSSRNRTLNVQFLLNCTSRSLTDYMLVSR